jgi:phenylacetate-CoA ligase
LRVGILLAAIPVLDGAGSAYRRTILRRQHLLLADREMFQMGRVRELVRTAMRHSPYYQRTYAAAGIDPDSLTDFAALALLPLLEKDALRSLPPTEFQVAHPRFTKTVMTAGSTGKPVVVVQSLRWWARSLARRAELYREHGLILGSREGRFWGRGPRPAGRNLKQLLSNRKIYQFLGSTEAELAAELADLQRYQPDYVYGYASLILNAARLATAGDPLVLGLKAVITTAETITPSDVANVRAAFDCPVINEYGCSELDIMAFDCPHGSCHVQTDHVLVEAIPDGIGGHEAVVTDLDNDVMPLIRYRLGDVIEIADCPCACGRSSPVIKSIRGRTIDQIILLPDGSRTHAVCFAYILEDLSLRGHPFTHFRVFQESLTELRYVISGTPTQQQEALRRAILADTHSRLSSKFRVAVDFGEIPRTPGQKYTYFVPFGGWPE